MPEQPHPPAPGPVVQPNFHAVMEAVAEVTFPISKDELLEQVGDGTVLLGGRNVGLHELIKDIYDDRFDSEAEFMGALEDHYGFPESEGVLPTGLRESWQSRVGLDDGTARSAVFESKRD